jgi:hypothetical protein
VLAIATSDIAPSYSYADTNYANPRAVTSVGGTTYAYDNNGNVTAIGSLDYTWDWRNRLKTDISQIAPVPWPECSIYIPHYNTKRLHMRIHLKTPWKCYKVIPTIEYLTGVRRRVGVLVLAGCWPMTLVQASKQTPRHSDRSCAKCLRGDSQSDGLRPYLRPPSKPKRTFLRPDIFFVLF